MSIKELSKAIDKTALLSEGGLSFPVLIKDAKISYGQPRYLITPVGGSGEVWVNDNRIKF
jgi:hypothetical protein